VKPTTILTAVLLCFFSVSATSFAKPIKVFILAGQSNMEGHGGAKTLDQLGEHPTHGYLLKNIKNDDGSFVVREDVFVSYQKADEKIKRPLSVGVGAWGRIGSGRS
jgi:alpha-galactosidase